MKLDADELIISMPLPLDHNNNNNSNNSGSDQGSDRSFSNSGSSVASESDLMAQTASIAPIQNSTNKKGIVVVEALNIDKLSFNCTGDDRLFSSSSSEDAEQPSSCSSSQGQDDDDDDVDTDDTNKQQEEQQTKQHQYSTITSLKCHSLYKIQEKIRSGGFGDVFKGVRKIDLAPIAIKIIRKEKINSWTLNVYY